MANNLTYNYLEDYTKELRSNGRYSFTIPELRQHFTLSDNALKKSVQRLKKKKEIAMIRKEFYVIVPPEYYSLGVLPPILFIADLMKFLKRNYYTALLNAAAFYGAAHQQPQEFFVITTKPVLLPIRSNKIKINFRYKKEWAAEDIIDRKTDSGYVKVSSPELTALDIVHYSDRIGGLNRTATILQELAESLDAKKLAQAAQRYGQIATIQRLGFLLDEILDQKKLTLLLFSYLKTEKHYPILLSAQKDKPGNITAGNNWKVIPNTEIEPDL